jgi:DNA primase catalytic core
MNWIEELKSKLNIVEVISHYCGSIKSRYNKVVIKCPFHYEKTASCHIDRSRNFFHCFGCKTSGDSIRFVELIEKTDFLTACTKLAHIYGVEIVDNKPKDHAKNKQIKCLELITSWSENSLKNNLDARMYLESRGLRPKTIRDFRLGWFGKSREFSMFCQTNTIDEHMLDSIGLPSPVIRAMQNRIIFPIGTPIIGLAGRVINGTPKYLNTAESILFKKRETVYSKIINNKEYVVLVEGYLDVCLCYQQGISAVSCMGTAINKEHLIKLWQNTDHIVICLDSDEAGKRATIRIIEDILPSIIPNKLLTFINLPDGHDPASFIVSGESWDTLPQVDLPTKMWQLYNPNQYQHLEKRVACYNQLLQRAEQVSDINLRRLYIKFWKEQWFNEYNSMHKHYKGKGDTYRHVCKYDGTEAGRHSSVHRYDHTQPTNLGTMRLHANKPGTYIHQHDTNVVGQSNTMHKHGQAQYTRNPMYRHNRNNAETNYTSMRQQEHCSTVIQKYQYESILTSIIIHRLEIFDTVCDYFLDMNLEGELHEIRERILKNANKKLDLLSDDMVKCYVIIHSLNKISRSAPFIKGKTTDVIQGWLEMFKFYKGFICESNA